MAKTPKLKEILTKNELAKINELRISLLKSESSFERIYYKDEINKIFDNAKERYFNFFKIVKKHINKWDPVELLNLLHLPEDEYEAEIRCIANAIVEINKKQELALKIKEVFTFMFDREFDYKDCFYIAEIIWNDYTINNDSVFKIC